MCGKKSSYPPLFLLTFLSVICCRQIGLLFITPKLGRGQKFSTNYCFLVCTGGINSVSKGGKRGGQTKLALSSTQKVRNPRYLKPACMCLLVSVILYALYAYTCVGISFLECCQSLSMTKWTNVWKCVLSYARLFCCHYIHAYIHYIHTHISEHKTACA